MAGFNPCLISFFSFVERSSLFWDSYWPHNAAESLLNYVNILQHLNKENGVAIHYVKYVIRSMAVSCTMHSIKNQTKQNCSLHQATNSKIVGYFLCKITCSDIVLNSPKIIVNQLKCVTHFSLFHHDIK